MSRGYLSSLPPHSNEVSFSYRNEGRGIQEGCHRERWGGRALGSLVGNRCGVSRTFTSQMLMPPSMPVVQNFEHLALPPLSTEIWLQRG